MISKANSRIGNRLIRKSLIQGNGLFDVFDDVNCLENLSHQFFARGEEKNLNGTEQI